MKDNNALKITRFFEQYKDKQIWQIKPQIRQLIIDISESEVKYSNLHLAHTIIDKFGQYD